MAQNELAPEYSNCTWGSGTISTRSVWRGRDQISASATARKSPRFRFPISVASAFRWKIFRLKPEATQISADDLRAAGGQGYATISYSVIFESDAMGRRYGLNGSRRCLISSALDTYMSQ